MEKQKKLKKKQCVPSRTSLLSGKYAFKEGTGTSIDMFMTSTFETDDILMSQVLQEQGYETLMLGKWDLGYASPEYTPGGKGFDESLWGAFGIEFAFFCLYNFILFPSQMLHDKQK